MSINEKRKQVWKINFKFFGGWVLIKQTFFYHFTFSLNLFLWLCFKIKLEYDAQTNTHFLKKDISCNLEKPFFSAQNSPTKPDNTLIYESAFFLLFNFYTKQNESKEITNIKIKRLRNETQIAMKSNEMRKR